MKEYEFQRDAKVCMGDYELSCDRLAELFCKKHGFGSLHGNPGFRSRWVEGRHGEVLATERRCRFDMSTIVDDICLDIPKKLLMIWYEYHVNGGEMDYRSWAAEKTGRTVTESKADIYYMDEVEGFVTIREYRSDNRSACLKLAKKLAETHVVKQVCITDTTYDVPTGRVISSMTYWYDMKDGEFVLKKQREI